MIDTSDTNNYQILYNFTGTNDGSSPDSLILGNDGYFYGCAEGGGDLFYGTLFRVLPPEAPAITGIMSNSSGVQINFSGLPGLTYQLFRSTNLSDWTPLPKIIMPTSGIFTNLDVTPNPSVYYRPSWIP
jgi:hypothetical protein